MAKSKFDLKEFFLKRGELLAMGVAGFVLFLLLIWSAGAWSDAKDSSKIASQMAGRAANVHRDITSGTPDEASLQETKMPEWLEKSARGFKEANRNEFTITGPLFDPTAQPNTKRENPLVFSITDYQVDLTRSAMQGFDIILDTEGKAPPLIGVYALQTKGKLDEAKLKTATDLIRAHGKKGKAALNALNNIKKQQQKAPPMPPMGPGPFGPGGPGPGGPGPGGPGPGAPDGGPGFGFGGPGFGPGGPGFNPNEQRIDNKVIKYIPLDEIDTAVKEGNQPAITVIPLRMITIHAVVPYKRQVTEIRRAGRFRSDDEARRWGPWYDGFEVQRRVTRIMPNGEVRTIQPWPTPNKDLRSTEGNYPFEEKYIELIDTRKFADHFDEGYIPYFLKPEMMLSMPLPQLAKDLNVNYPKITLKAIDDNIEKLNKQPAVSQSELAKRLQGIRPKSDIYRSRTADTMASGFGYNPNQFGGPTGITPPGQGSKDALVPPSISGPGGPILPKGYDPTMGATTAVDEIENFLLRFVDCDVQPGYTYEYRIRLRMLNPNYGLTFNEVANPEHAKENFRVLYSPWTQLTTTLTVPAESYLYAYDVKTYRDQIDTAYIPQGTRDSTTESRALNKLLQAKDNQAVVQIATWMDQVRTEGGTTREPVGAWVVAEMPVGRGEFIGRKQLIKLPLWSSVSQPPQYLLREVPDKVVKGGKEVAQPKGWLVDFSTKSILVDFEGGRVKTRAKVRIDAKGNVENVDRDIVEDAATEMLIVQPNGKLSVRNSLSDETDEIRTDVSDKWSKWLQLVESRKNAPGTGLPGEFDPKKP